MSKTELVYQDLCNLYRDINENRRNPRAFRLAFEFYIFKSQQLTEAMRSEYPRETGLTWTASKFEGWNGFTNALKKIRNAAMHHSPVMLDEAVLSIYPNIAFATDTEDQETKRAKKKYRATKSRSFVSDAFSEEFTTSGLGYLSKENFSKGQTYLEAYVFPIKEFVYYELRWEQLALDLTADMNQGKRVDAVKLVLKSFPILKAYMAFYRGELEKNLYDSSKEDYLIFLGNGMGWVINPKYRKKREKHSSPRSCFSG